MAQWEAVLDEVVGQRYHVLVAYALVLTGDRSRAEDLVQDALIATFGRSRSFSHARPAEAYVKRAIASRFIDAKRKSTREASALRSIGAVQSGVTSSHESAVVNRTAVEQALLALAPRQRACVVLRYLEQFSTAETAAALKIKEGSVKRYLSDGIARLSEILGPQTEFADPESAGIQILEVRHDR